MIGRGFQLLRRELSELIAVEECTGKAIRLEHAILPVHSGAARVFGDTERLVADSAIVSILVRFVLNRRRRGLSGEAVVPASWSPKLTMLIGCGDAICG